MKAKVVKSSKIKEHVYETLKVRNLFNTSKLRNVSVALIHLNGINKKVKNTKSDIFYYVLKGKGMFTILNKEYEVFKGDLVFIPKGTSYFDKGKLTMLSIVSPRFDSEQVKFLD